MIFKSPEQLVEFFNNLDLDKSTLVFKTEEPVVESDDHGDCACQGAGACQCPSEEGGVAAFIKADDEENLQEFVANLHSSDEIVLESFSDSPSVKLRLTESGTNVFYVSDYEAISDACGTGRIELPDRVTHMNMCEQEGVATVYLDMVVEGKRLSQVPVTLSKTTDEPYLLLSKDHFSS